MERNNKMKDKLTWEIIKQLPCIKFYAGDIPIWRKDDIIGMSLTKNDCRHIRHNIIHPFPLKNNSIDRFESESVFEYISYHKLPNIVNEIYRILKSKALFRLSVPDYACDVLQNRVQKDVSNGEILSDSSMGNVLWFPKIDAVKNLLKKTKFYKFGKINFLHYYDKNKISVIKPIDYTKGFVKRTPDFDERTKNPYRVLSLVIDLTKERRII